MIVDSRRPRISPATYFEAFPVLHPLGLFEELDLLVHDVGIEIVDLTSEQALLATTAAKRFGKGYYPARLNFGDCFSYALARATGEPLLFKGNDFFSDRYFCRLAGRRASCVPASSRWRS